jgi:mannobiose 2-epimerase
MSKPILNLFAGISVIVLTSVSCGTKPGSPGETYNRDSLASVLENSLKSNILDAWYPKIIDSEDGGYFSNLTYDMKVTENQPKMLVTQSRQIWTSSQAAMFYNDSSYIKYSRHGARFLIEKMWDQDYGGFFNLRTKAGGTPQGPAGDEKKAYGNAFAIYGLSSYYEVSKDPLALEYAKKAFLWLDEHSHDAANGGYIDAMDRSGTWLSRVKSGAVQRGSTAGSRKDFNSSIHLLEALTALYNVWPDELVKERLTEMLRLVRDTFTTPKGYLILYFTEDWQPVTNKDSSESVIRRRSGTDHISFGHDVETGFLLLEASHALGIENDVKTLGVAKRLVDHSLANGIDKRSGGFFDAGYYFSGSDTVTILNKSAEWWVQSEGLNSLLLMSEIFPEEEKYFTAFLKIWDYIDKNLIDKEYGDWYIRGLNYNPEAKIAPKASIWKANYHNGRALINCTKMLKGEYELTEYFKKVKQ